jgi:hypothetical protein
MGQRHGAAGRPSSLRGVVRRAHLGMALMAMALAGSLLLLAGLVALRVNLESNLQLMARSVAYTVEAAVVFKDAEDAGQTLAHMLAHEGVARAVVRDAQGAVFAQWLSPACARARGRRWRGWRCWLRRWRPSATRACPWARWSCAATARRS